MCKPVVMTQCKLNSYWTGHAVQTVEALSSHSPGLERLSMNSMCRIVAGFVLLLVLCGCRTPQGVVMNNSGKGYMEKRHFVMARHEFSRALAAEPCNAEYRHNLAMAIQEQGDAAGAEALLRKNLTIDATHQPTYHSLAALLHKQGRTDEAMGLLQTWADTQCWTVAPRLELAWLYREMGQYSQAEQELCRALQIDNNNPYVLAHLGQAYQDMGQPQQAAFYYRRSLVEKPGQMEVRSRLATVTHPVFLQRYHGHASMASLQGAAMPISMEMMGDPNQMMMGPPPMYGPMAAGPCFDVGLANQLEMCWSNPKVHVKRQIRQARRERFRTRFYRTPAYCAPMCPPPCATMCQPSCGPSCEMGGCGPSGCSTGGCDSSGMMMSPSTPGMPGMPGMMSPTPLNGMPSGSGTPTFAPSTPGTPQETLMIPGPANSPTPLPGNNENFQPPTVPGDAQFVPTPTPDPASLPVLQPPVESSFVPPTGLDGPVLQQVSLPMVEAF